MTKSEARQVVRVKGVASGSIVELDVGTIVDLMAWYVKDAPREHRTLNKFLAVSKMYSEVSQLLRTEIVKNIQIMESRIDSEIDYTNDDILEDE